MSNDGLVRRMGGGGGAFERSSGWGLPNISARPRIAWKIGPRGKTQPSRKLRTDYKILSHIHPFFFIRSLSLPFSHPLHSLSHWLKLNTIVNYKYVQLTSSYCEGSSRGRVRSCLKNHSRPTSFWSSIFSSLFYVYSYTLACTQYTHTHTLSLSFFLKKIYKQDKLNFTTSGWRIRGRSGGNLRQRPRPVLRLFFRKEKHRHFVVIAAKWHARFISRVLFRIKPDSSRSIGSSLTSENVRLKRVRNEYTS